MALCPVNAELKFPSDIRIRIAVDLRAPYHCFCRVRRWSPLEWLRRPISGLCFCDLEGTTQVSMGSASSHHYRCCLPNHQYNRQSIFTLLPVSIIPTKGTGFIVIKDSWHHAKTNNAMRVPLILKQLQYMKRLWERFKTRLGWYSPQLACSGAFFASQGYLYAVSPILLSLDRIHTTNTVKIPSWSLINLPRSTSMLRSLLSMWVLLRRRAGYF